MKKLYPIQLYLLTFFLLIAHSSSTNPSNRILYQPLQNHNFSKIEKINSQLEGTTSISPIIKDFMFISQKNFILEYNQQNNNIISFSINSISNRSIPLQSIKNNNLNLYSDGLANSKGQSPLFCHADITTYNDEGQCGALVSYSLENIEEGTTITQIDKSELTSGDIFPIGVTLQKYEIEYEDNTKDTCQFTVTVIDNEAPLLGCPGNIYVKNDTTKNFATVHVQIPDLYNPEEDEKINILLLYADYDEHAEDVAKRLESTGFFSLIHTFNISSRLPKIKGYDAILLWRNNFFNNSEELGNVLTEFVDSGGGLVMAAMATSSDSYPSGNFDIEEYGVIVPDIIRYSAKDSLGTVFLPDHPLMNNVKSFKSGDESYKSWSTTLTPGSYRVADWAADTKYAHPLIAAKENVGPSKARRVDLNFFPPATAIHGKIPWDTLTDGDIIMANALLWAAGAPTIYDNCGNTTITNNKNTGQSPSGIYPIGTTEVTLTVTDESENSSSCSFSIIVEDREPPTIKTNALEIYLDQTGRYGLTPENLENMASGTTDNYSSFDKLLISAFPETFDCSETGQSVNVMLSVEDEFGNSSKKLTTVTLIDTFPPIAQCRDINLYLDKNGQAILNPELLNATGNEEEIPEWAVTYKDQGYGSYDACNISSLEVDKTTFYCEDIGNNTVNLTVLDPSGNTAICSSSVNVKDTVPPIFIEIEDIDIEIDIGETETTINYPIIEVSDNCSSSPILEQTGGLGSDGQFPLGTTTETYSASDDYGNTSLFSFNVHVSIINKPPIVVNPIPDHTIYATQIYKLPISPLLGEIFDDPNNDPLTISTMLENGDPLPEWAVAKNDTIIFSPQAEDIGCTNIIVKAMDLDNASVTDTFELCVIKDEESPVIVTNPIDIILDITGSYTLTSSDLTKITEGTTDNLSTFDNLTISASPNHFSCKTDENTVKVLITVKDENENTATKWVVITLLDTIPPIAICQDTTIYLNQSGEATLSTDHVNSSLNKEEIPEWGVTYNNQGFGSYDACSISSLGLNKTEFNCEDIGENIITMTVTDISGNSSTCNATVLIKDTISPVFDPIDNINIEIEPNKTGATIEYPSLTAFDNCTISPQLQQIEGLGPEGIFPPGSTTETWLATDESGNTDAISFTVNVTIGNSPPVVVNHIKDQIVNASYILKVSISPVLGEIFDDADGDILTTNAALENGNPLPEWASIINDTIVFSPLIEDIGCINILVTATDPENAFVTDTFELCVEGYPVTIPDIDESASEIKLYPNPANKIINIHIKNNPDSPVEISIFTVNGDKVMHNIFPDNRNISFNMSKQLPGVYFAKIKITDKIIIKKFVLTNNNNQ